MQVFELSLVENNNLNDKQLALILKKTPVQYKQRPCKGGGVGITLQEVTKKKCLNLMFDGTGILKY
jgi:hypothetical protein